MNAALRINPRNAIAYNNRGYTLYEKGDYVKAIADYNKSIEIDPTFAEAYFSRSTLFRAEGKLREAIVDARKAFELRPDEEKYRRLVNELEAEFEKKKK